MENMIVNVLHLSTSKKVSNEFKGEVASKTAYLTVAPDQEEKLIAFGLQRYTSKADNKNFFIVKLSSEVAVYYAGEKLPVAISGLADDGTPNFEVDNLQVNIIKGEKNKNTFYRVQALKVGTPDEIREIVQQNPFGE